MKLGEDTGEGGDGGVAADEDGEGGLQGTKGTSTVALLAGDPSEAATDSTLVPWPDTRSPNGVEIPYGKILYKLLRNTGLRFRR